MEPQHAPQPGPQGGARDRSARTSGAGRSAVVTGGARGIGRAIATELVRRGYAVVVADIDGDEARRTAGDIGAAAGIVQDVRDEAGHREAAAEAARHGRLQVWVNNAGVGYDGPIAEQPADQVSALLDVNLKGVVWGCRAAVAAMQRGGEIVNVASLSGHGPVPGLSVYAATKAAVVSLTGSLDSELRGQAIRVHAICPDGVDTRLVANMNPDGQGVALVHSGGRLLTTAEIARATVALVGTRRVVRTVPAWRGAMMRLTAAAPSVMMRLEPLMRFQGRRRMRKAARSRS
jgi:NAD(P)-dependent dehydrogenase (short-subunit alcohol dehydrogenase family)